MNLVKLIIIFSISILGLFSLIRNEEKGICFLVFMLILMPRGLYIQLGDLPSLTIYRAIIIVLIFYFLFLREKTENIPKAPFLGILSLVFIQKLISLLFAFDFSAAFNGLVIFTFEILVFYIILNKVIDNREKIDSFVASIVAAIFIIAIVGFIENYTQFNPTDYLTLSDSPRFSPRNVNEVYSTFDHPIHFGYALAMGWPLCIYLLDRQASLGKKRLLWIGILLTFAGSYFSYSRGAWLGLILAAIVLGLFKYPRIKIRAAPILILIALALILRPGIYDTIQGLVSATVHPGSLEGGSFYYRFELFKKAYSEISKSPIRIFFGYGDGAHHSMELRGAVSYGIGRVHRFWSWDNQFAIILLEGGFFGLALTCILYFWIMINFIKLFRLVDEDTKSILTVIIASISVFIFMMSNVAIFSPQLYFIMWTNVAMGVALLRLREEYRDEGSVENPEVPMTKTA